MIELDSPEILVNRNAPLKCSAPKFEAGCFGIGHHFVTQNSLFRFLNQHIHTSLINHHNKNYKFGFHFLRPNNDKKHPWLVPSRRLNQQQSDCGASAGELSQEERQQVEL